LMALVHKSLLHQTAVGRYDIHDLLQVYAAEKLEILGEPEIACDAHMAYYAEFLHQREEDLKGLRQLGALDEIEADFENMRAAWNWAIKCKNYTAIGQLLRSLGWFCTFRSRSQEHKELLQQARKQLAPGPSDEPHPIWGRILVAEFYARPDEVDRSQIERGLAIVKRYRDLEAIAVGVRTLGEVALRAGDYAQALSFFEESLGISRGLKDSFNIAAALFTVAEVYRVSGQPDQAISCARQSLVLSRKVGDLFWAASSLINTGIIALYTGNYTEAEDYLREANTIYRQIGYKAGIADSGVQLGKLAFVRGALEDAKSLGAEALQIATDIGNNRIAESARYLCGIVSLAIGEKTHEQQVPTPKAYMPTKLDRFEVKELLGLGSVGAVYLAHDPDSDRNVVLKVANPEALKRFDWLGNSFRREAATMVKLSHPAIPECYDYVEAGYQVYMVMEYLEGKDLEQILQERESSLPQEDVIKWSVQICDALIHLHGQKPEPYILRDLKPSNVMLGNDAQIHLIDLGIMEAYQPGRELPKIGTIGYSPPEQYIGYSDVRSDVYALGATLHHLLTRRDPREETPFSFHYAPPRSLNPDISEELEAVILRAVEHNPEDRYQGAEELKIALLACL
jgi:tetratricopeptide (TPR) repeat protein